ncbi:MAG: Ig-like domain-containing protein [Nannocystaceae bacterium]
MLRAALRRYLALVVALGLGSGCNGDDGATGVTATASDGSTSEGTSEGETTASTTDVETTSGSSGTVGTSTGPGTTDGTSSTGTSTTMTTTATTSDTSGSNGQPIANSDFYIAKQRQIFNVGAVQGLLANDADGDGDALKIIAADPVSTRGAQVQVEELGGFTYQPPADVWGDDSFHYTVWDGKNGFDEGLVRIAVNPTTIDLGDVADGNGGFVVDGEAPSDYAGSWVAGLGDVDGDGYDDLGLGARFSDVGFADAGSAYVVFGKSNQAPVALFALDQGLGFPIRGEGAGDQAGTCIAPAGDLNHDGLADVLVGAPQVDDEGILAGRAYAVFGKESADPAVLADVVNELGGYSIDAEGKLDLAGKAVARAGDVNGDGLDDLIVGAYGADPGGTFSGRSYILFGAETPTTTPLGKVVQGLGGVYLDGEKSLDFSGHAVAGGGDINGDGLDDLIVGAYGADPGGDASGRTYVIFGATDLGPLKLADVAAGKGGFALDGELAGDRSGTAVAFVGDVNGDGFDDLAIGAHLADPNGSSSGKVYVVFGEADPESRALAGLGDGGFVLDGPNFRDYAGFSVDGGGDVNGDGLDDVIVGAYGANADGDLSGRTFVFFGREGSGNVQLSALIQGDGGFALDGEESEDYSGFSVANPGDVNGDGFADVLIGAKGSDAKGLDAGRAYVVHGGDFTNVVTHRGTQSADSLQGSAADDVMIGGRGDDTLASLGGHDVLYAGLGGDMIEIVDLAFARIDGGRGDDTLRFTAGGLVLDLTAIPDSKIVDIEVIALGDSGNTVILGLRDLYKIVGASKTLRILGGASDTVEADLAGAGFQDLGEINGFAVYANGGLRLEVASAVAMTVSI